MIYLLLLLRSGLGSLWLVQLCQMFTPKYYSLFKSCHWNWIKCKSSWMSMPFRRENAVVNHEKIKVQSHPSIQFIFLYTKSYLAPARFPGFMPFVIIVHVEYKKNYKKLYFLAVFFWSFFKRLILPIDFNSLMSLVYVLKTPVSFCFLKAPEFKTSLQFNPNLVGTTS